MTWTSPSVYQATCKGGMMTPLYLSGTELPFESILLNITFPPSGSTAIPPDHFKLIWKATDLALMNHMLERVVFFSGDRRRFVLPLSAVRPLVGREGIVPFATQISDELIDWIKNFNPDTVSAHLVFRSLSVGSHSASLSNALSSITQYGQNDVLFWFPARDKNTPARALWSKSATLAASSPYFKTLFESNGFSETEQKIDPPEYVDKSLESSKSKKISSAVVKGVKRSAADSEKGDLTTEQQDEEEEAGADEEHGSNTDELDYEDSDLENDCYCPPSPSPSIYRIVVRGIAYKTLLSYLCYVETGFIQFDHLSSLSPAAMPSPPPPPPPHLSLDPTCSPKSMYRLASFYEHQQVRELAYEAIASQLDCQNALVELWSDLANDFAEIKQLAVESVLDNWSHVRESKALRDVEAGLAFGGGDGSSASGGNPRHAEAGQRKVRILFELLAKLSPTTTKT